MYAYPSTVALVNTLYKPIIHIPPPEFKEAETIKPIALRFSDVTSAGSINSFGNIDFL